MQRVVGQFEISGQQSPLFEAGNYSPEQLDVLKTAFDSICAELRIKDDDGHGRERIAKALVDLSNVGQTDIERLKIYAMSRYRATA